MLIDLSHVIEAGMTTYKGLPGPVICDFISREASRGRYAPGTEFLIGRIDMVGNTGTYLDAPFHRFANGKDLSEMPIERMADLDTVVVRADAARGLLVDASAFQGHDVRGKAVLVHTGWDRHWRTEAYQSDHPALTGNAAQHLVEAGAALVGIDSHNIDDTRTNARPVHTLLLGAEIPIVEHMTGLDRLPDRGARFFAAPLKIRQFGTVPVRAFCQVEHDHPS